jgi:hypothetical protein
LPDAASASASTFTGLRIGVATACVLAQSTGAEVAVVSTRGLAAAATERAVLAGSSAPQWGTPPRSDGERLVAPSPRP